jgi:hypothetical protein
MRWKRQTRNWLHVAVVSLNPAQTDKTENSELDNQIAKRTAVKPQTRQLA